MELVTKGIAGTLESGDILIEIESRAGGGISIDLKSKVFNQFGEQILKVIRETIEEYGIHSAVVRAVDQGSLDCTIRARVTAAIHRGCQNHDYQWR